MLLVVFKEESVVKLLDFDHDHVVVIVPPVPVVGNVLEDPMMLVEFQRYEVLVQVVLLLETPVDSLRYELELPVTALLDDVERPLDVWLAEVKTVLVLSDGVIVLDIVIVVLNSVLDVTDSVAVTVVPLVTVMVLYVVLT